jgi:hypothetical protein
LTAWIQISPAERKAFFTFASFEIAQMESKPISRPRPIFSLSWRLPALESEDVEANVASASFRVNQQSWAPNMQGQRRENWWKSTPDSYISGAGVLLFVLSIPHAF